MLKALAAGWWIFLLRGVVAVLLGLLLWLRPAAGLATLVLFFGAWMLVDGAFTAVGAVARRHDNAEWGWMLASGLVSLAIGGLTLSAPGITAIVLLIYVAAWAMVLGISQIALGWRIRKEVDNEWMLYLGGAVSLFFGFAVLWNPAAGALGVVWMIAFFAIAYGATLIGLSLRLRGLARRPA
jgi:uncharacterized membrane protein HdeD (DUF308 family)